MWVKDQRGRWVKKDFIFTSTEFERTFQRITTYAKCVNASTYSVANRLDNIYEDILYQHGFYIEFLNSSPDELIISGVLLKKGKMYNLSITHTQEIIVNNKLDYEVTENEEGILEMSIRTAIALEYIKAANSLLFQSDCGFTYWNDYVGVNNYENDDPNFDCYKFPDAGTNGLNGTNGTSGALSGHGTNGTSGTSGDGDIAGTSGEDKIELIPIENIMLDSDYTEEDVYDVWNNNILKQGWSLPTYWTPAKTIQNLLANFRLVDVASTKDYDLSQEWTELKVDEKILEEDALILLKDQDNAAENGVYEYQNSRLWPSDIFDDIEERQYFSCFIQAGLTNREKHYFLERLPNGDYPYFSGTTGELHFVEGLNYAIRNRVDYKLLAFNTYNDSIHHIDNNPILNSYERFDLSVEAGDYTYKVSDNANWIERIEDGWLIGFSGLNCEGIASTAGSGTSGEFKPLNLGFRLNSDNDLVYYVNIEFDTWNIYQLETITNQSTCYYSTTDKIVDFTFVDELLYILILNEDDSYSIEKREKDTLTLLDTYALTDITIDEFRVVRVIDEDWFYFITPDIVYQWHPNYGLDVISEENARYLIVRLDERAVELESVIQSSINYPIQILGSETIKEDRFGFSAALSNDNLIVGAPDNYSGIAYLFNQGTNGLTEVDSVRYDESTTGNADLFATSISIENNTVVIGAPATNTTTGEVYVYDITSNQFTLVDILSETSTIAYGYKVFISNNTIFVSAPVINEVYVYQLNISWELTQTIVSPSVDLNQQFGASLHVENNILVIGAPNSNSGLGEVFVYQFDGTQWNYLTDLSKNDASVDNDFGTSVFVYDPFIFVGATGDSADTNNGSGSVYVFRQDTLTSWSQASKIKPDDSNQTTSQFGSVIYYDSVKLFVGAPSYDIVTFSSEGAVYTYAEQGFNNWVKLDLITSPNPKLTGQFGQSVVANNSIWFTGELNDNYGVHNQLPTGYVYENIIEMLPGGTDGTSGLVDRYVQLSWVKQDIKYPTRIEKNVKYLTDYQNWQKESEFFIYDDFSKTEQGDWKIEGDTLTLKGQDILDQSTAGLTTIPKVSNTIGRYFDGKDDHVVLPELSFDNIIDFSIEFAATPDVIKTNTRIIYLGSEDDTDYDSVEFIEREISTGKPRFQLKAGDNLLTIDSTIDLPTQVRTRITITLEMSNSTDIENPYSFTGRIWFDDQLAGSNSGLFTHTISDLRSLVNNYVARSSNLQDPLYLGVVDEYRISGIVLNPAQVAARNVPIIENDVTYNDLVYYWDLLDEVSLIQEKIQDKDGIFIGGLFTDETLSLIYNPNQILFDQNEQYLYILSQELDHDLQEPFDYDEELLDNEDIEIFDNEDDNIIGFENPPTFASAIFRIDLRTEDVDLITEMDNIQSMYVKDNQLFWLTYHNIYQENDIQPVVENVLGAVDFCVVFDKIFYVDREYKIFDENKTLVFEITFSGLLSISTFQTTNSKIDLFYGFYQTNSDNWYNVYVKNYDGRIFILSSQFISSSDTLQLKGIYPFYLTDFPNAKKGVSLNGKDYYITTENRVVEVVNENIAIDLDPLNRYWNWNVATLFGINGYDKYLFIGSINLQQEVQVWRYDTETRQHLLLRKINRTVFFDSTNPLLDLDLTNNTDPRLIIIKENAQDVENYKVEKSAESLDTLENLIVVNPIGVLTELSSVTEVSFFYVSTVDNDEKDKYLGFVYNQIEYGYWEEVLEIEQINYKLWVGDFGVALKHNNGTTGHTLDLLNTEVKSDFYEIELGIDRNLNSENYIVPTWDGRTWIYGLAGSSIISDDYGERWNSIATDTFSNLQNASYYNRSGLVVGDNATILETNSDGIFLSQVAVPTENIQNRHLNDVLIYEEQRALVVGDSGLILHLTNTNGNWNIDRNILNDEVDVVTEEDLDYIIEPSLYISGEKSILRTNYTKILYVDGTFWLFGDKQYIANLELIFRQGFIQPVFNFYLDPAYNDNVLNAETMIDYTDGIDKFLLTSQTQLKLFTKQGSVNVQDSNLFHVILETIDVESGAFDYKTSFIEVNQNLNVAGFDGNIKQGLLQDRDSLERINPISFEDVDPILKEYFKPRMLIADYYLARKINILFRDDSYIIPSVDISKSIFSCIDGVKPLFNEDEFVQWNTVSRIGQPNYLAYQDWYFTTRRLALVDGGINSQGLTKYFPYNKKFVAKNDLTNYKWSKTVPVDETYPPPDYNSIIKNELWSNSDLGFPEEYIHTTLYVDTYFNVTASDVIELKISRDAVNTSGVDFVALLIKDSFIVKAVEDVGSGTQRIVLWYLLDPEILTEFEPPLSEGYDAWTIDLDNLNYFNRHLTSKEDDTSTDDYGDTLKGRVEKHLVGEAYKLIVNQPDIITIQGIVNQETKYSNLESEILFYTSGENNSAQLSEYEITYDKSVVYGPDYNLYQFLNQLDSIFTPDYEFMNLQFSAQLNARSGDNELTISRNYLYAGENYIEDLVKYRPGTWVDISRGDVLIERVFINEHEFNFRDDGSRRMRISFDTNLSARFFGSLSLKLRIKSRFKLGQISSDLNWTDNINFPTPATDGDFVEVGTNGTSGLDYIFTGQKGSYYHGWNDYLRTATVYTKLLADNEDVKKNISAIVWIDDENDLKLNVYSWDNDPNFAFRPLDLHQVGMDATEDGLLEFYADFNGDGYVEKVRESKREFGLKKAVSIYPTNWGIRDNIFGLIEIDITKYNFILTDGLTLQRLNDEFFWILNADIRNAVIGLEEITEINGQLVTSIDTPTVPVETSDIEEQTQEIVAETDITDGANVSAIVAQESLILRKQVLRWYEGDWICGTWEDGVWYSGEVYAIKWIKGQWFAHPAVNNYNVWTIDLTVDDKELSVWNKGEWGSGIWYNGIWYDGIWYGGSHIAGDWFNGEWLDGEWLDGSWSGGTWSDGTWLDGIWNADNVDSIWENGTWLGGDFENGVWNNGIWDQGADKTSRFGTKSTSVQQSIWKFGIWKNGEFHNYLNQNEEGEPIASESYKYSKWLNGIWLAGNWYGGTWSSGRWENGVWHYGFWRSQQRLKYVELIQTEVEGEINPDQSRLVFFNPHYYNVTTETLDYNDQTQSNLSTKSVNRATIIGEPDVNDGELDIMVPQLGWNSFPVDHAVEIIDDYTLNLKHFIQGQYENNVIKGDLIKFGEGTNGTDSNAIQGTNGTAGIVVCVDETLEIQQPEIIDIYNTAAAYLDGPLVVSHWLDGTWRNGIWEFGYWGNGRWEGGIWLNGVWERGNFGA